MRLIRNITGLLVMLIPISVFGQLNIVNTVPSFNQAHVPSNADIEITFDDNTDPGTISNATFIVRGSQSGRISGALSGGGTPTVIFDPVQDFKLGEIITVTVTDQVFSLLGIPLARGVSFSFMAISGPPPALPITFAQRNIEYDNGSSTRDITTIDYDRDGDLDILTATEGIPEGTFFVENDGIQNFTNIRLAQFRYVEVHDLDEDGDFDAFGATGSFDTELNWFENEGTTPFTERFINSQDPWTLTGGDLDSDGDIDVLAAVLPSNLIWYANDGSGNFTPTAFIATSFTGGSDSFFEIVDINSDGAMDILAFHLNDQNLVWYQNDGNQNFTELQIENTTQRQRPLAADIDEDGDMDIFTANTSGTPELNWYENDGNQNFTKIPVPTTSTQPLEQVQVVDMDGDLDLDILAGWFWFSNDGNENFTEEVVMAAPNFITSVHYGDVDSDGDMDVVSEGRFRWFENTLIMNVTSITPDNGNTGVATSPINVTFDQPIDAATLNSNNFKVLSDLRGELAGTLNGGGSTTIAFIPAENFLPGEEIQVSVSERLRSTSGHSLPRNFGFSFSTATLLQDPTFVPVPVFTHSGTVTGLDLADMDRDGDLDMITCTFTELFWHENDGNGNFTQIPIPITIAPEGVYALDQNGDGFMDLVVDQGGFNSSFFYLNDGSQNFTETTIAGIGSQQLFETVDINYDGDTDMLFLGASNSNVVWADVISSGYTSSGISIQQIASRDVRTKDIDNDGDADFVAAATSGTSFYENDGFFNFPNVPVDATGSTDVVLSDLDGDRDYDLVVLEGGGMVWYENRLNEPSNDFNTKQTIPLLATNPRVLIASDMDGDGDPDIVITSENDDIIEWQENRLDEPTNDFLPININTGFNDRPQDLQAGDLDGDGDLDIAVISPNDNELNYYENLPLACVSISISTQPVNANVCVGDSFTLFVDATGDNPITYQWQFNGFDIGGATTNSLTLPSAVLGDDGDYQCIITNPCGTEFSDVVTVTVEEPVTITSQPQSQVIMDGSDAMLSVTATGSNLSYQWQKDGSDISGAINPTLNFTPWTSNDEGSYVCVISNLCNTVTSNAALLTLAGGSLGFAVFDTQQNQEVNNGQQNPVDFGTFNIQESAMRDFEIENTGGTDLIINSIISSDPSFSVSGIPSSVPDQGIEIFTITLNTQFEGSFNSNILIDTDAGSFQFPVAGEVTDSPGGGDLVIYNAVAPDGDGQNDYFKIENIETFDPNRVEIYNRWGDMVFEISGYDNQVSDRRFEGVANVSGRKELPEGNYFYVIFTDNNKQSGYLFLRR